MSNRKASSHDSGRAVNKTALPACALQARRRGSVSDAAQGSAIDSQRIENTDHADAHIRKHCRPKLYQSHDSQKHHQDFDGNGENNIFEASVE